MNGRQRQAIALAFMRSGVHDIRPDLLLYVAEHDDDRLPRLFGYGCQYLAKRYERAALAVPEDAVQVAVVDALAILRMRKAPYTLKERAGELRLRTHVYGAIRKTAVRLFEQRYHEALARFEAAMSGSEENDDRPGVRITADHRVLPPQRTAYRLVD